MCFYAPPPSLPVGRTHRCSWLCPPMSVVSKPVGHTGTKTRTLHYKALELKLVQRTFKAFLPLVLAITARHGYGELPLCINCSSDIIISKNGDVE
eukprot:scaffold112100_cov23-Tisochrysis_lutea.AAC.3